MMATLSPQTAHAAIWWAALALGVLASAIFSGLETGTYVLNKVRLDLRAAGNDREARRLSRLLRRPAELLSVLLVSNTAVNLVVSAAAVALFTLAGSGEPDLMATLVLTPALFVLGDSVPKNIFRQASEVLTYRLSGVLWAAALLWKYTGLTYLVAGFARLILLLVQGTGGKGLSAGDPLAPHQRVSSIVAEAHAHGTLTADQSRIANRLVRIGSTRVEQVMVRLPRIVSIPLDCSRERFLQTVAGHNFSRLPLWQDHPAHIVGTVNIYDVLTDEDPASVPARHLQPPLRLSRTLEVSKALVTLQRAHEPMAVVVDRAGKPVGIVTIKDLVEEIVGELQEW